MFPRDWKATDLKENMRSILLCAGNDQVTNELITAEAQELLAHPTAEVIQVIEDHSWLSNNISRPENESDSGTLFSEKVKAFDKVPRNDGDELLAHIANQDMRHVMENALRNGDLPFDHKACTAAWLQEKTGGNEEKKEQLLMAKGKEYFLGHMEIPETSFNDLTLATFLQEWDRSVILMRLGALKLGELGQQRRLRLKQRLAAEPDRAGLERRFDYEQVKLQELDTKLERFQKYGIEPDLGKFL